jgi:isocitrate dehydrogenase
MKQRVTVAYGDGIGPEIMEATLKILEAAGADFEKDVIEIGENVYKSGHSSGIKPEDWKTIAKNKVLLKAPITTPQGGGYKSLNVTLRKTLGLFANIRPVRSLSPFVATKHPEMDIVIVRENEEDLYAGIEHRQTPEVYQCLKLVSQPGCEKIVRYAFEYAKTMGRKKVTCMSKDNIMKLTDGVFHETFDKISKKYPEIETDHWIIDIGAAKLASEPQNFDVVVTLNLYGDIISDIVAEISGSVGLAGSSNIGENCAMFEAIHGSAPMIAGQGIANPSGILLAATQMLKHIGQGKIGTKIENAWLKTIEEGVATSDIYTEGSSSKKVNTQEFADEVISRLGQEPVKMKARKTVNETIDISKIRSPKVNVEKQLQGIDIFLCDDRRDPNIIGTQLINAAEKTKLKLQMITNRGIKVFPDGNAETFCTDHWRCRFESKNTNLPVHKDLWHTLNAITDSGLEVIKTELLYNFDGKPGYSLGQGQ